MAPLLGACTGDEDEPSKNASAPTSDSGTPVGADGAAMRTRLVRVGGDLTDAERTQVKDTIAEVVGRWFDAAYLGGDLPDEDLPAAFEVFTRVAAQQAASQADVTTGRVLAGEFRGVVPTTRRVEASVFAPEGGPAGATAQVTLVLVGAPEEGDRVEQVVRGELFLTTDDAGWRVFGFDLSRSVGAVGTFANSEKRAGGDS